MAIGRSCRGDRAADRQTRRQLEAGEHLDDAAPTWPYRVDHGLRPALAESYSGTGRGVEPVGLASCEVRGGLEGARSRPSPRQLRLSDERKDERGPDLHGTPPRR